MNALMTGATGFLGRRLVRELLSEGWRVRCLLRPSSRVDSANTTSPRTQNCV